MMHPCSVTIWEIMKAPRTAKAARIFPVSTMYSSPEDSTVTLGFEIKVSGLVAGPPISGGCALAWTNTRQSQQEKQELRVQSI